MKVCFETFGCRLNKAEALQQEAEYLAGGWERTESHSDADLIVVRGCSVTRRAQKECEKFIAGLRRRHPLTRLVITGCFKDDTGAASAPRRNGASAPVCDGPSAPDAVPTRTARAYLKVQDGCSGKCAFCIVPQFRGASVSVPFGDVLSKARRFIDAGYTEIVVTGCNLSLYASEGRRLPELVDALAGLGRDRDETRCRIRMGSLEPGACALETVDAMGRWPNVCRFLHVPVQSGADRILTAMKRPYLVKNAVELVEKFRKTAPLAGIGCDLMTGFPGETEMDFLGTEGLLKRLRFSNTHIFPYSERPSTTAAGLPDALPRELRHERAHRLADVARSVRSREASKFIGQRVEIVVEDEDGMSGWTGEYFWCKIANKGKLASVKRRDIITAHVTGENGGKLAAVVL